MKIICWISSFHRESSATPHWLLPTHQHCCLVMMTGWRAAGQSYDQYVLRGKNKEIGKKTSLWKSPCSSFGRTIFLLFWRTMWCSGHAVKVSHKHRRWVGASGRSVWYDSINPGAAGIAPGWHCQGSSTTSSKHRHEPSFTSLQRRRWDEFCQETFGARDPLRREGKNPTSLCSYFLRAAKIMC